MFAFDYDLARKYSKRFHPYVLDTNVTDISTDGKCNLYVKNGQIHLFGAKPCICDYDETSERTILVPTFNNVTKVFCGIEAFAFIDSDKLYILGVNYRGSLGVGHEEHVTVPIHLFQFDARKIKKIMLAINGTLIIEDGKLYVAGRNPGNMYGLGESIEATNVYLQVQFPGYITDVDTTFGSMYIIANNNLYTTTGQYGKREKINNSYFSKITYPSNIKKLSIGLDYICLLSYP